MSDDIEALPDVWPHNSTPLVPSAPPPPPPSFHIPVPLPDGFAGPPQKAPLNDGTFYHRFIFLLFIPPRHERRHEAFRLYLLVKTLEG